MASDEAMMESARVINAAIPCVYNVLRKDTWWRLRGGVADALDAARAAGRADILAIVTEVTTELEKNYDSHPINTAFRVARKEIVKRAKKLEKPNG